MTESLSSSPGPEVTRLRVSPSDINSHFPSIFKNILEVCFCCCSDFENRDQKIYSQTRKCSIGNSRTKTSFARSQPNNVGIYDIRCSKIPKYFQRV